jgi:hypothetical protein
VQIAHLDHREVEMFAVNETDFGKATRTILFLALIFTFLWCPESYAGSPTLSAAQCDITISGMAIPACPSSDPDAAITTPAYNAVRSDQGLAAVPVDVYGLCRYIDNNSTGQGTSIFVPFNSGTEWQAFLDNLPSYMSVEHCSKPTTFTVRPGPGCYPVPPATSVTSQSANFPYARFDQTTNAGVHDTVTLTFNCTDMSGSPWTQTAYVQATGLDSDIANPSWQEEAVNYSTVPTGICGNLNGYDGEVNNYNGCPYQTANMTYCASGIVSALSCRTGRVGNGSVGVCSCTWTCSGTSAQCSARGTTDN